MKNISRSRAVLQLFADGRAGADRRRTGPFWLPFVLGGLALLTIITSDGALGQEESAQTLAEHSAIVLSGKVLKTNASNEPLVTASSRTAVISVSRMYAGREIAGDQTGRTATVILSRPERLKVGEEAFFFGNVRFVGRSLTIADEGEISSKAASRSTLADLERGVQARTDRPVLGRLSDASLVFRGTVEKVRALDIGAAQDKPSSAPRGEHDPEWHVASVRVATPLRGGDAGQVVTVVFPASRDVVWFNAPKLKPDQDAIFITHKPGEEDAVLYRASGLATLLDKEPAYLVIQPFDVLPPTDEARVRGLLAKAKENK